MCLSNKWAAAMASVLDAYYGTRRAWREQGVCFEEAILEADPGRLGPVKAAALARRQAERGFDIQLWLSGGASCGGKRAGDAPTQASRLRQRRDGPDPLLVE
jgi:hypothetical protein